MVAEGAALLAVKRFKKRRGGIAPVIRAELVDLIEHEDGIPGARLLDTRNDASRHRADVGFPVAADLRLVVHAAERNAGAFAVCGAGNAHGNARFANTRRAYKTEHPALDLRRELPHGKVFQNAVFDLCKAVVILVQDLFCVGNIGNVLCPLVPRELQADIQIRPQHRALGRTERLLAEPRKLLEKLFFDLVI